MYSDSIDPINNLWEAEQPPSAYRSTAPSDIPESSVNEEESGIIATIKSMTNFASILRIIGAITVIAAMSAFLIQDWASGNDINRYYILLTQTILLALGGLGLSYGLKENKGARVFFGLGLISITMNMSTLGALIFSMTQWGSELAQYPGMVKWVATDFTTVGLALLVTLAVSAPVAIFSQMVLARKSFKMLVVLSLFTNLLLLFPVRESLFVGVIVVVAILVPLYFMHQLMKKDNGLRTPEGAFAIASLFIPALIIIARSVWLYPVDELLTIILGGTTFTALRIASTQMEKGALPNTITNGLSLIAAFFVAMPVAMLVEKTLGGYSSYLPSFGIVFAALMLDVANRAKKQVLMVKIATVILAITTIIPAIEDSHTIMPLITVLSGLSMLKIAKHYGLRDVLLIGVATLAIGIGAQSIEIFSFIDFGHWSSLATLGVTIIITASLIERHGAVMKLKWEKFTQE